MTGSPTFLYDNAFDDLLPRYERERSRQFWTPVAVAARVAAILSARGARKILDVGCGPGKFCIVAACSAPKLEVHGIEQRPRLVRQGRRLVRDLRIQNVVLATGDATKTSWDDFDGLYFFNPFSESTFMPDSRFDDLVDHSTSRFGSELLRVESLLDRARRGTMLVTYHGLGGPIPSSYDVISEEPAGTDKIRVWVKGADRATEWLWFETPHRVVQVSRVRVRSAQARLLSGEVLGVARVLRFDNGTA